MVDEVRHHFPQAFRVVIPRSVRLSEAPSFGQSIFRYAPDSVGATTYRQAATELQAASLGAAAPVAPFALGATS